MIEMINQKLRDSLRSRGIYETWLLKAMQKGYSMREAIEQTKKEIRIIKFIDPFNRQNKDHWSVKEARRGLARAIRRIRGRKKLR